MMALLEINNLTKKYGKFVALDGVNLSLGEGKIVGLLGPNGSGKTTLMKCVAGLLTPDGGSITVDGKPIGAETKKIVSFLPERTYLRPTQTVASVLEYFSLFYEDFDVSAAEKMLNVLGVNKKAELKTLSKGTKEKVQLIAVMARRARLYLLDHSVAVQERRYDSRFHSPHKGRRGNSRRIRIRERLQTRRAGKRERSPRIGQNHRRNIPGRIQIFPAGYGEVRKCFRRFLKRNS